MLAGGCASVPPLDNPVLVRPAAAADCPPDADPQPSAAGYAEVYERVLDALDDYFDIVPGSRYAGEIRTYPRTAPGYEQPWKPSTPDPHERWLATFQSIRHTAVVRITAAERGGFRVYVEVYKELEVMSRPGLAASATPVFRDTANVDRRSDVLTGPATGETNWMPSGEAPHRDYAFEQVILRKVQRPAALK
jgi:hypothetical protein